MTTRKVKEVSSRLCGKGFVKNDRSDHCRFLLYVDGRKTRIRTMISHGEREIGEELIHRMAAQLKLSKDEFLDLVDCRLDGEEYAGMLMEKGLVERRGPEPEGDRARP